MDGPQRIRFLRLYITSIRSDLSRLEDLAADFENNHPVPVSTVLREVIDSIIDAIMKIESQHGI